MINKIKEETNKINNFADDIRNLENVFRNNCHIINDYYYKIKNSITLNTDFKALFFNNHYDLELIKYLLINPFKGLDNLFDDIENKILCFYQLNSVYRLNLKFLNKIPEYFKEDEKIIFKLNNIYKNYVTKIFYKKIEHAKIKDNKNNLNSIIIEYKKFENDIKRKLYENKDLSISKFTNIKKKLDTILKNLFSRLDFLIEKQESLKNILFKIFERLLYNINKIFIKMKNIHFDNLYIYDNELIKNHFNEKLILNIKDLKELNNLDLNKIDNNVLINIISKNIDSIKNNLAIRKQYLFIFQNILNNLSKIELNKNNIENILELKNLDFFYDIFIEYHQNLNEFFIKNINKCFKFFNNQFNKNNKLNELKLLIKQEINNIKKLEENIKNNNNDLTNKNKIKINILNFINLVESYYFKRLDIIKNYKDFFIENLEIFYNKVNKLNENYSCFNEVKSINNIITDKSDSYNDIHQIINKEIEKSFKIKPLVEIKENNIYFIELNKSFIFDEINETFNINHEIEDDKVVYDKDYKELYKIFLNNNPELKIDNEGYELVNEFKYRINDLDLFFNNILFLYKFGENNLNYFNFLNELLLEEVKIIKPWNDTYSNLIKNESNNFIFKEVEIKHPLNIPFLPKFSLVNSKYYFIKIYANYFLLYVESKTSKVPASDCFINYNKFEFILENNFLIIKNSSFIDFIKRTILKSKILKESRFSSKKYSDLFKDNIHLIIDQIPLTKSKTIELNQKNIKKLKYNDDIITNSKNKQIKIKKDDKNLFFIIFVILLIIVVYITFKFK